MPTKSRCYSSPHMYHIRACVHYPLMNVRIGAILRACILILLHTCGLDKIHARATPTVSTRITIVIQCMYHDRNACTQCARGCCIHCGEGTGVGEKLICMKMLQLVLCPRGAHVPYPQYMLVSNTTCMRNNQSACAYGVHATCI